MGSTTKYGLPYPEYNDKALIPDHIKALAEKTEEIISEDRTVLENLSTGLQGQIDEINYNAFDTETNPNSLGYNLKINIKETSIIKDELGEIPDDKTVQGQIDELSNGKVDKVDGKGLSTNDYTTADKNKVDKIEDSQHRVPTGSTVQSQIDEINDSAFSASNPDSLTNKVGSALSGISQLENGKVGQKYNGGTGEIFNSYANNVASGSYSHAEGNSTTTIGVNSHAEGKSTNKATTVITNLTSSTTNDDITAAWVTSSFSLAKGNASSVSGLDCLALADYSHAEGNHTTASGTQSHAEGYYTTASGSVSHAEGERTTASGSGSHAEGEHTTASGNYSHAEGEGAITIGAYSHAEGYYTTTVGSNSHAEGERTTAFGRDSHAEGKSANKATAIITNLSSDTSDSVILSLWDEHRFSLAKGIASSVSGADCLALGDYSHAEGRYTTAIGANSNTNGYETIAKAYQFVAGKYNAARTGVSAVDSQSASEALFSIGYGTSSASGNAFTVYADGTCKGVAAFEASGADYAEYFEWADGNPDGENRVGRFVTLDGDKIRIANSEDDYILGVVSGNGSFIGNAAGEEWQGKYLTDIYGTRLTQTVEIPEHTDEKTGETVPAVTVTQYVLNPEYDPTVEYIPRASRKEWAAVGMLGQLTVTDDGTCTVNGYCRVSNDGTATAADSGYRVLKRLDDAHVSILYR